MKPGDRVKIEFAEPRPKGEIFLRWEGLWGVVDLMGEHPEPRAYIDPGVDRPDGFGRTNFWWPIMDLVILEENHENPLP